MCFVVGIIYCSIIGVGMGGGGGGGGARRAWPPNNLSTNVMYLK